MTRMRAFGTALAAGFLVLAAGCRGDAGANQSAGTVAAAKIPVTIETGEGSHTFNAEVAATRQEQDRGLMYRTDLGPDDAMIFTPYPAEGGPPREASFWMQNTPTPLDIIFIRADGTIARIVENTIPYSQDRIRSGEPVSAVLEVVGGRTADLGISEGDTVRWPGQGG
ncbi:DUF192 domain-containing protein [Sphingosinithalassobacter sp. LHW66-3]|uniref:DUF192 domain-containing protein n=1 Tax=Sphingosinithalassobacter sp. LHW66-3 TaxID=3424718 RepID=UPI003D6BFDE4